MEVRRGRPSEPKSGYTPTFDPKEIREQLARALDKRIKYEFGETKAEVEQRIDEEARQIVANGIEAIARDYGIDYGFGEWRIRHGSPLYSQVRDRARAEASDAWNKVFERIEAEGIDITDAQYKSIRKAYTEAFVESLTENAIHHARMDARAFQGFDEEG